jgi:ABC-type transporter Mla subunit MlaD
VVFDAVARLIAATVVAFAGMAVVKSQRHTVTSWIVRAVVALPLFVVALWLVLLAIPYPRDPGMPTFSIVASAVFVTALGIDELIGSHVRRLFGI